MQPFADFSLIYPVNENLTQTLLERREARLLQNRLQELVDFRRSMADTPAPTPSVKAYWTGSGEEERLPSLVMRDLVILVEDLESGRVFALKAKASSVLTLWLSRIIVFYAVSSVLIVILAFWIFRVTTKPFLALQHASDALAKDGTFMPVSVQGPAKVRGAFEAFNAMQERVTGLLEERRRMIAALSHDLKTLLTRFSLRADYIEAEDQRAKAFSDIEAMNRTLDQMVMYARSEDSLKPTFTDVDLLKLLKETAQPFESESFSVMFDDFSPSLSLSSDPVILERIVQNIVSNASRFASALSIRVEERKDEVALVFSDNGCGIPDADKEHVFQPYYSADSARNKNKAGSGLGFMIIRNFTALLGGRVELSDNTPSGLVVGVILPQ